MGSTIPIYQTPTWPGTEGIQRYHSAVMPPQMPGQTAAIPGTGMLPQAYYPLIPPMHSSPISYGPVQTAAGPLARTIPLAPMPILPPPDVLAPCLFNNHLPYNSTPMPSYGSWPPPVPPQPPAPAAQPITPPPEKSPQPPEEPKKEEPPSKPAKDLPTLTPDVVREINANLQANSFEVRLQGAQTLARVLQGDPDILSKPEYSQYAEALVLKVLKDPNSIVRQPILLAMEVGNLNDPTPKILTALNNLKKQRGLYNFEPGIINTILTNYKTRKTPDKSIGGPKPGQQPAAKAMPFPQKSGETMAKQQGAPSSFPSAHPIHPRDRAASDTPANPRPERLPSSRTQRPVPVTFPSAQPEEGASPWPYHHSPVPQTGGYYQPAYSAQQRPGQRFSAISSQEEASTR